MNDKSEIKNILVPTDFSDYGDRAVDSAITVAKQFNAKVHLFHSIDLPDIIIDQPTEAVHIESFKASIAQWSDTKMQGYQQKIIEANLDCSIDQVFGDFLAEVENRVKSLAIDLVIMGSQGASGKKEWFIGSNTQKALRKLHIPVIVVKNRMEELSFSKVLFVSGLNLNERPAFKRFLSFISHFNVEELHIMSVNTKVFFTQPGIVMKEALKEFEQIAVDFKTKTHFFSDTSVDSGVRNFIKENDIDFVGMSHNVRHPIKRLFQGSNVEIVANHCDVPLMAVDYPE